MQEKITDLAREIAGPFAIVGNVTSNSGDDPRASITRGAISR
jgi:hypothetical protein